MDSPTTITGTVKRFEWTNPHAFIYLEVKTTKAPLSSGNRADEPQPSASYGWMRTTVKAGDQITCTGGAAKSGAPSMISALLKLPDGRELKS